VFANGNTKYGKAACIVLLVALGPFLINHHIYLRNLPNHLPKFSNFMK
jgi:hypothetical protein